VIVALFTGMRRGELLALRWHRIDFDRQLMHIREALEETKQHGLRFKKTKSKISRTITLPDIVVAALREHYRQQLEIRFALGLGKLSDDALVFPALEHDGPQSPRQFSGDWAETAAQFGMPEITLHALRHTHASQLIDAGVDVVTISKRLGHASPNIT